jgi:hypothetical protein
MYRVPIGTECGSGTRDDGTERGATCVELIDIRVRQDACP